MGVVQSICAFFYSFLVIKLWLDILDHMQLAMDKSVMRVSGHENLFIFTDSHDGHASKSRSLTRMTDMRVSRD